MGADGRGWRSICMAAWASLLRCRGARLCLIHPPPPPPRLQHCKPPAIPAPPSASPYQVGSREMSAQRQRSQKPPLLSYRQLGRREINASPPRSLALGERAGFREQSKAAGISCSRAANALLPAPCPCWLLSEKCPAAFTGSVFAGLGNQRGTLLRPRMGRVGSWG